MWEKGLEGRCGKDCGGILGRGRFGTTLFSVYIVEREIFYMS